MGHLRDLQEAGESRPYGEHADRPEHRRRPLAVAGVRLALLAGVLAGLAVEHEQHQPERVEGGDERPGQSDPPDRVADPIAAGEGVGEDLILGEEAGERRHTHE